MQLNLAQIKQSKPNLKKPLDNNETSFGRKSHTEIQ